MPPMRRRGDPAEGRARITAADLDAHMYLPELPPVDVVVRTSGERRISNFMLWQSAGSPVYFTEQTWPDFGEDELDAAIADRPPLNCRGTCRHQTLSGDYPFWQATRRELGGSPRCASPRPCG